MTITEIAGFGPNWKEQASAGKRKLQKNLCFNRGLFKSPKIYIARSLNLNFKIQKMLSLLTYLFTDWNVKDTEGKQVLKCLKIFSPCEKPPAREKLSPNLHILEKKRGACKRAHKRIYDTAAWNGLLVSAIKKRIAPGGGQLNGFQGRDYKNFSSCWKCCHGES